MARLIAAFAADLPSFLHKFLHTDSDFQSRNIWRTPSDAADKDFVASAPRFK